MTHAERAPLSAIKTPLRNRRKRPVELRLEPWGETYVMPAGVTFQIVARGPEGDALEIEWGQDRVTVYGWPGSVVSVLRKGVDVAESEVGARDGEDGVVPIVEDDRDRDAGASHRVNTHMAHIDAFGGEVGDDSPAELVIADAADHGNLGAEASGGGRLVAALAADEGLEATGDEGLTELGQARGADDEIHHERPNDGDPGHGESVTAAA